MGGPLKSLKRFRAEHGSYLDQVVERLLERAERATDAEGHLAAVLSDATRGLDERMAAAWVLGRLHATVHGEVLRAIAYDEEAESKLRAEAARSYARLGSRSARELRPLAGHESAEVASGALYGIGLYAGTRRWASDFLLEALKGRATAPGLRALALDLLSGARRRDQSVVRAIGLCLDDPDATVRFFAIHAAERLNLTIALASQLKALTTDSAVVPGWGSVAARAREALSMDPGPDAER